MYHILSHQTVGKHTFKFGDKFRRSRQILVCFSFLKGLQQRSPKLCRSLILDMAKNQKNNMSTDNSSSTESLSTPIRRCYLRNASYNMLANNANHRHCSSRRAAPVPIVSLRAMFVRLKPFISQLIFI